MATGYDASQAGMDSYDVAGSGWLTFAATLLGLAGAFNIIDGIVGLSKSKFFTANATYVFSDLHTWSSIRLTAGDPQPGRAFTALFGGSACRGGSCSRCRRQRSALAGRPRVSV